MNKEKILKKFMITNEDIEKHPFLSKGETKTFYVWLADFLQLKETDRLDCEKITVARNIVEKWKIAAKEAGFSKEQIGAMFLFYAPKADEALKDNEICLFEGCIC